jgi:hypothetical protein
VEKATATKPLTAEAMLERIAELRKRATPDDDYGEILIKFE